MSQFTIPGATYDRVFSAMLGTTEDVEGFRDRLTETIRNPFAKRFNNSPYKRLRHGLFDALGVAVDEATSNDIERQVLVGNGELGITLATASLKTVGDIYKKHAETPQRRSVVERSVKVCNAYVMGGAFTNAKTTIKNMSALRAGVDPALARNSFAILENAAYIGIVGGPGSYSHDGYVITSDEQGQISAKPKYARVSPRPGNTKHCPATEARIPGNELVGVHALAAMISVASDVVIDEIYPQYFGIVDDRISPTEQPDF